MKEVEVGRVKEIRALHIEIDGLARTALDKAIRIGELLTEQKAAIAHGEWLPWIKGNCPFSARAASDYMNFWERRDELKSARLADLAEARRLLVQPRAPSWSEMTPEEVIRRFVDGSLEEVRLVSSEDWHAFVQLITAWCSAEIKLPEITVERLQVWSKIMLSIGQACAEMVLATEARIGELREGRPA